MWNHLSELLTPAPLRGKYFYEIGQITVTCQKSLPHLQTNFWTIVQ